MTAPADRRDALLDRLADFVLAHGLDAANLRAMARAAGTSDRMLLYYFPDKAALLAATLERVAARLTVMLDAAAPTEPLPADALRAVVLPLLLDPAVWPYMRVWLTIASRAAHGDALSQAIAEQLGRGFLAWSRAHLAPRDSTSLDREAAEIFALFEGVVLLKALGLGDVAATLEG